jgi:CheY-like chemotaxis protein
VINARDATPDRGVITISTANTQVEGGGELSARVPAGDYVVLRVEDTGAGMDDATRARIFEPFFTTKPAGSGTGLGLSTVLDIANASGGHVVVDSAVGRGSSFRVYFPRAPSASAPQGPPLPRARTAPRAGHESILLVDADAQVRSLLARILRHAGYRVVEAADAEEALEVAGTCAIDLLVTDVILPRTGGPELAARLGANHPDLSTLFVSGHSDQALLAHGVLGEGVELARKPLLPDVLLARVRKLLDERGRATPAPS